jgi:hypothetical protein
MIIWLKTPIMIFLGSKTIFLISLAVIDSPTPKVITTSVAGSRKSEKIVVFMEMPGAYVNLPLYSKDINNTGNQVLRTGLGLRDAITQIPPEKVKKRLSACWRAAHNLTAGSGD